MTPSPEAPEINQTPATGPAPVSGDELEDLIAQGSVPQILDQLDRIDPADLVRVLSRLSDDARTELFTQLDPERAAKLLQKLPYSQAVETVGGLEPASAARVLEELQSDERADFLGEMDEEDARPILEELSALDADEMRVLTAYEDDVAGGLMKTEYLEFDEGATIADVIADLGANAEEYADYDIQYAYVTNAEGALVGVLPMRDLLLAARSRPVRSIMIKEPLSVPDTEPLDKLVALFDRYRFFGVPVVDHAGTLVGVVQRASVEQAVAEDQESMYRSAQGIVGGEELRTMPVFLRARRRLSWLSINIVLNLIAASVIAMNQATLEAVIALAVFLPIISDMSGCSGNQAVAVSMRELTLGVIKPTEILRTVLAELSVGLINGLVLGLLIGIVATLWQGNAYLGLVVGSALFLNTVLAVCVGGSVPLILKRLGVDPAIAAGPILTTLTDMCGFFLVLTFASLMLARLV